MCTYTHKRPNIPLQGLDRRALTVGAISGPTPTANWEPSFGAISPVVDLHGRQKAFRESRQVNISQWR